MATMDSVVREHGAGLLCYATRLTGDRYLAEDVVQETWLRAWRHEDRLNNGNGSVRGWLWRIAHNVAVDQHRARKSRPCEVGLDGADVSNAPVQASPGDDVEDRLIVDQLLERLSPVHRKVVVEVYFTDRTATSAAGALGVPVGTVKSRLHNALRTLREQIPRAVPEAA